MFPDNFLTLEQIRFQCEAGSKKRVLEEIGTLLAASTPGLEPQRIFDKLLERERLGSTGVGEGIALPHARIKGVEEARGALVQLSSAVDFDAIDNQPVDLVFGLIVPEQATDGHLKLLAKLASLFSRPELCTQLRNADDGKTMMRIILGSEAST